MSKPTKPVKDRYDKSSTKSSIKDKNSFQESADSQRYRKMLNSIKCVQCQLASIVRDPNTISVIDDAVKRMNRIVTHSYRFLKLYLLYHYHQFDRLPVLDKNLIECIQKTVSSNGSNCRLEGTRLLMDQLDIFNRTEYSKVSGKLNISSTGLSQMIKDQTTNIYTSFKNLVQEHFCDIVKRYTNIIADKNELIKNNKKKVILRELQKAKNDILLGTDKCKAIFAKQVVSHFRTKILKDFTVKTSLESMAEKHDLNLLLLMIRMSIDGENVQRSRLPLEEKNKQIKVINCFPIRTSIIPSYVDLDGQLLTTLLIEDNKVGKNFRSNLTKKQSILWALFFKTNHKIFRKKGYKFDYRISTDGVGCSIKFIREDIWKTPKKQREKLGKKPKNFKIDKYVNHITPDEREQILKMSKGQHSFVGIDPGKRSLIYCTNGQVSIRKNVKTGKIKRKALTFQYTNGRRKEETRTKYFQNKLEKEKLSQKVGLKTIKSIEQSLSAVNANSCIWENVCEYMKLKSAVDKDLLSYYENKSHRLRKWYLKSNKRRSEANMVNRFEKTFGSPKETVILMGDWSENRPMKFQEPTMGKSIRRLFRNRGYKMYLVDEYNTSKRLIGKGDELFKFRKDKSGNSVHRVLTTALIKEYSERKFQIMSHPNKLIRDLIECGEYPIIINRDLNGSLNIRWKGMMIIFGLPEPDYMNRSKRVNVKDELVEEIDLELNIPDISLRSKMKKPRRIVATKSVSTKSALTKIMSAKAVSAKTVSTKSVSAKAAATKSVKKIVAVNADPKNVTKNLNLDKILKERLSLRVTKRSQSKRVLKEPK